MKTIPSVLLACALFCSGCVGFGRPPQYGAGVPPTSLGTPVNPTQVTPQTDSTRAGRPSTPTPAEEPFPDVQQTAPDDAVRPQDSRDSDAPLWRPLEAPPARAPSAQLIPAVELGQPTPFPLVSVERTPNDRPRLQEQSSVAAPRDQMSLVTAASAPSWQSEFSSTGRHPIQTLRIGSGEPKVMIVGSIYGNEPESVALLDAVELNRPSMPQLPGSLLMIRTANPDGFAEHMRTNQGGVDLNRNFPSVRFTANPSRETGPHPASEVETQVLINLLRSWQPIRVVHVRSAVGSRPLVLGNAAVWNKIDSRQLPGGIDFGHFNGSFKAGSLEEYVSERMSVEMITILLPPEGFETLSPHQLIEVAFLNAGGENAAPHKQLVTEAPAPTRANLAETTLPADSSASGADWVPGKHGYVELLPPPPGASADDTHASRYYELPPPE